MVTRFTRRRIERFEKVIMQRCRALTELKEKFPHFEAMMTPALLGSLTMNRPIETKLVCVSEKEAKQIGKNLVPALKSKKLVTAGVDQWRVQNRAVKDLVVIYPWVEPMFTVLGNGIVKTAAWGELRNYVERSELKRRAFIVNYFETI